jgi:hypothetical protein
MVYEAPRLVVHGSIETLTLGQPSDGGNDPCRKVGGFTSEGKQSGEPDGLQFQGPNPANVMTCSL